MNLIFDFGGVLIDWDPHHLFDPYFGDRAQTDWFLANVCTMEWNSQMDFGKPFSEGVAELSERFPQWKKEIELYWTGWPQMIGGPIPGMYELLLELKARGHRLFGLSNWSAETYERSIKGHYPALDLLEGKVISGFEGFGKPDPKIFRLLLERYSLLAADCAFIDDNAANVAAANSLGIRGILFTGASDLRKQLL